MKNESTSDNRTKLKESAIKRGAFLTILHPRVSWKLILPPLSTFWISYASATSECARHRFRTSRVATTAIADAPYPLFLRGQICACQGCYKEYADSHTMYKPLAREQNRQEKWQREKYK